MRLLIQVFLICVALAFAACKASKPMDSSSSNLQQRNLAADKVLIDVFETGDVDKLDAIIDPAFINHAATGDRIGLDSLKSGVRVFHARMKSVKVNRKRQLADDEYVSDWVQFLGAEPTMVIEGMEVTRYANGKAIEHWFFPNSQARPH